MWSMLVFLSLLLMYGVSGTETDETEPVSVMEGDSVTLHTNLSEILNDDTILWLFGPKDSFISQIERKGGFTSFSVTKEDVGLSGRLKVDKNTGSLTIRNTRIKHSGLYKLTISREKTTTKIFNVTVSGVVGETDGVESLSVTEGEFVTLQTDVEMHKDALMLWRFGDKGLLLAKIDVEMNETSLNDADERFKNRLKLDHQTGSLTITNTRTTDSGFYELQIRGIESSQRFLLSVNAVPGLSPGAVAGIVVGVLVPVLLLVAAAFALMKYWHRTPKSEKQMGEEEKSVKEGDSPTLCTGLTEIQGNDTIEWCYEPENNLIAEINGGTRRPSTMAGADGRFRSKLRLDENNGDLTISNIRTIHSGLYKLKINSSIRTKYSLTVNGEEKEETVMEGDSPTLQTERTEIQVKAGDCVLLQTGAEIQTGDIVLWTFGPENRLVVKADSGQTIGERFRNRLQLNEKTGVLTIKNITNNDAGHYNLQITNNEQTTFIKLNVTVTDSSANQVNEEATVVTPLLNGDDLDGWNEQQETSSV